MNQPLFNPECLVGKGSFGEVFKNDDPNLVSKVFGNLQDGLHEIQIINLLNQSDFQYGEILNCPSYYYFSEGQLYYYNQTSSPILVDKYPESWKDKPIYVNLTKYEANLGDFCNSSNTMGNFNLHDFLFLLFKSYYHLYKNFVFHGDIKFGNILVRSQKIGSVNSYLIYCPTLCDFNISFRFFGILPDQFASQDLEYIQTLTYRSPELVFGQTDFSEKVELWSLGIVIFKLCTGSNFFSATTNEQQICNLVKFFGAENVKKFLNKYHLKVNLPERNYRSQKKRLLERINDSTLYDLVSGLLELDPEKRLSLQQVFAHPYFQDSVKATGFLFIERDAHSYLDRYFERHPVNNSNLKEIRSGSEFDRSKVFNQVYEFLVQHHLPFNILFQTIYIFDYLASHYLLNYNEEVFFVMIRLIGRKFYFHEHHVYLRTFSKLDNDSYRIFYERVLFGIWQHFETPTPIDYLASRDSFHTGLLDPKSGEGGLKLREDHSIWRKFLEMHINLIDYQEIINSFNETKISQ